MCPPVVGASLPSGEVQQALRWGSQTFGPDEMIVMAIVNRTPDSFYDRGSTFGLAEALDRVDRVVAEGAAVVDIGGVRAGPGTPVSIAEEVQRVVPAVEAVRSRYPELVISVDTYRADVADAVCRAGADVINDAWAGWDPGIAEVAAAHGAGLVCTHTGGRLPRTPARPVVYDDVVAAIRSGVSSLAERALACGVRRDGIVVDPAHDFGKDTPQSLEVTRRLDELVADGWPVLVALSRKDFVGEVLDLPVEERLEGTLAATAVSAWQGARVFRAHDVAATRRVLAMTRAIRDA